MKTRGVFVVFKKEIMDLFRDKKTVLLSILIPLIIFPIMFGFMGRGMEKNTKKVVENLKIAVIDKSGSSLSEFIKSQKNVSIINSDNPKADVQEGNIYAAIIIPEGFEGNIKEEKPVELSIMYDDTSQSSTMAFESISSLVNMYSKEVVKARLVSRGMDVSLLEPLQVKKDIVAKEEGGFGKFMLSLMLPMMLIIYAITGPMAAAIDLGAGEKERGTLEPLLTTQTGRMSLLFGKLLAITVMGLIGTTSSIIGVFLGFKTGGELFGGDLAMILPAKVIILMGIAAFLIIMVFGAVELAVSIYARSFKEAQTYLSPVTIIGMAAAYGTYMIEVKNVSFVLFNIPLVNIVMVMKELINGVYNPLHLGVTLGWSLIYIFISIMFAKYMFSREEVIFRT